VADIARERLAPATHSLRFALLRQVTPRSANLLVQITERAAGRCQFPFHCAHTRRRAGAATARLAMEVLHRLSPCMLPVLEHGDEANRCRANAVAARTLRLARSGRGPSEAARVEEDDENTTRQHD